MSEDKKIEEKLNRVLDIQEELDLRKKLYAEYDKLVCELQELGFEHAILRGLEVELVDNFKEKNTVYRVAGVKHYELKIKAVK